MNREVQFFDYEQCYNYYTKRIMNIRQAKIHGEIIVAKPVFLLAIIDGIDTNVFMNNQFVLNDWIEERYKKLMEQFAKNSQFDDKAGIEKPFWHLETDGFWHLNYPGEHLSKSRTPSNAENGRYPPTQIGDIRSLFLSHLPNGAANLVIFLRIDTLLLFFSSHTVSF